MKDFLTNHMTGVLVYLAIVNLAAFIPFAECSFGTIRPES